MGRDPHRSESAWLCPLCNTAYDTAEIESLLLDTVNRKFLAFNLQDLQCKKCAQVLNSNRLLTFSSVKKLGSFFQIKLENITRRCQCAGEFQHLISREDTIKLLEVFYKLGDKFHMPSLRETVEGILKLV